MDDDEINDLIMGEAVVAVILVLIIIHFFIMPLDIAWIKIQRRLHVL